MKNKDLEMGICEDLVYMMYNLQTLIGFSSWKMFSRFTKICHNRVPIQTDQHFRVRSDLWLIAAYARIFVQSASAGKCMSSLLCVSVEVN